MTYRSRSPLDLCHDMNTCCIQIPGQCQGYSPDGLQPVHANWSWANRGIGHKSDDIPAAGCPACHRALDSGVALQREDKERYWLIGMHRTMLFWLANGWLIRSGKKTAEGHR